MRRPKHPVGWLFCAIGFLTGADLFCAQYATYALLAQPGALSAGEAAAWVRSWFGVVGGGLGVFVLLLYPNGWLPSARWRYLVWLNVAVIFLGVVWVAFAPGPIDGLGPIRNPLGVDSLEIGGARSPFDEFEVPWFVIVVVATGSVLVRLHGAGLEERQQIKWFAYAAVVLTSAILLRVQTLGWASARPYARPPYLTTVSWRSRFVKGASSLRRVTKVIGSLSLRQRLRSFHEA